MPHAEALAWLRTQADEAALYNDKETEAHAKALLEIVEGLDWTAARPVTDDNGAWHSSATWAWLDGLVQRGVGAVTLSTTENGDVGVFWPGHEDGEKSIGGGDTAEEAVEYAMRMLTAKEVPNA